MDAPPKIVKRLEREAEHQRYYLKDGSQVTGCSTIAKLGDSPEGLISWAHKLGMEGKDYRKFRDKAADTGTIAHFLVDCHLNSWEPDLREFTDAEIASATPSFDKFLNFWEKEHLTMLKTEDQLVHDVLQFGGTLDLRALDEDGKSTLIDWKSSKAVYNSHKWQLGGYELLNNYNYPELIVRRRAIVRIGREEGDKFKVHWITDDKAVQHMAIFTAQVNLHRAINSSKYGK